MEVVEVKNKKQQKKFLDFRKKIYANNPMYVDNNRFMLQEVFAKRTCFMENKNIYFLYVEEQEQILCQGVVIYAEDLPEYIQLCFFESEPGQQQAVTCLVNKAMEYGRMYQCEKLVIGLNGHVNYGLGFLASHYEDKNSFSSSVNPEYYNEYFKRMDCEEIYLNTYEVKTIDQRLERYGKILDRIYSRYTFRFFNRKQFEEDTKIYTDLNNTCFNGHRYYYRRKEKEDKEMLKELFLFMKEDSLIFAFDGEKPIGFVMWYPDYNELVKKGDAFGAKHFFKNLFLGKKITTGKVMEFGVLKEYRGIGLPVALLHQIFLRLQQYHFTKMETSWILEENGDSNSVCKGICDETYKRYVVYEKRVEQ